MKFHWIIFYALILTTSPALAFDQDRFVKLADETVRAILTGDVGDIDALIARQDELIKLGVEGAEQYKEKYPEHAQFLQLIIDDAENMKAMTLAQIEERWHEGGLPADHGIDIQQVGNHFGFITNVMDAVVHPATARICFVEYKKTGDSALLEQAKAELAEVISHAQALDPGSH